jgi:hypothetical protein
MIKDLYFGMTEREFIEYAAFMFRKTTRFGRLWPMTLEQIKQTDAFQTQYRISETFTKKGTKKKYIGGTMRLGNTFTFVNGKLEEYRICDIHYFGN